MNLLLEVVQEVVSFDEKESWKFSTEGEDLKETASDDKDKKVKEEDVPKSFCPIL